MHRRHVAFLPQTGILDAHLQAVSDTLRRLEQFLAAVSVDTARPGPSNA
jgi:hypothetical protein